MSEQVMDSSSGTSNTAAAGPTTTNNAAMDSTQVETENMLPNWLLSDGAQTLVQLKAGDKIITVHRMVLIKSSQYFAKCFSQPFVESTTNMIEFDDIDPVYLAKYVSYCYLFEGLNDIGVASSQEAFEIIPFEACPAVLDESLHVLELSLRFLDEEMEYVMTSRINGVNCTLSCGMYQAWIADWCKEPLETLVECYEIWERHPSLPDKMACHKRRLVQIAAYEVPGEVRCKFRDVMLANTSLCREIAVCGPIRTHDCRGGHRGVNMGTGTMVMNMNMGQQQQQGGGGEGGEEGWDEESDGYAELVEDFHEYGGVAYQGCTMYT